MSEHERAAPVTVTVLVMTYDHERFIRQALDGALMQETAFDYEILISEDCSTDGTREIVLEYQRRHPERIRLLLSERNLHSNEVVVRGWRAGRGKYIALLDGDDYWTSPHKLSRQVEFLERRPECSMCFHNARVLDEATGDASRLWTPPDQPEISTLREMWMGNFIATCSTMYRAGVVPEIPAWYVPLFPITDWPLHLLHAEHGPIGYLGEVMGVYRHHAGGLYSSLDERAKLESTARFYSVMDRNFGGRYRSLVREARFRYFFDWAVEYERRGEVELARDCLRRSVDGWPAGVALRLPGLGRLWLRLFRRRAATVGGAA
jgi:glycosyltransferase involved in cell wall biosynthesis